MGRSEQSSKDRDRKDSKKKKKASKRSSSDKKHKKKEHKRSSKRDRKKSSSKLPNKHTLVSLGDPLNHPPTPLLNPQTDYFAFHEHLWVYLYRNENTAFNDLTSEESHEAFARFVEKYNTGELEAAYYQDTLPAEALEEVKTTKHTWNFRISSAEDETLRNVSLGIRSQTEYQTNQDNSGNTASAAIRPEADQDNDANSDSFQRKRSNEDRYHDRVTNKRLKEHIKTVHEELTCGRGDYGRDRQIEKRKDIAERTHGAAREREYGGVELNDDAIFGSDERSFQSALQREKKRAQQQEEQKQARLEELRQKEEQKKLDMMQKLGIKPGQKKIVIQPRNDG